MAQQEIEIILMRQLASYLTVPIFVVDPAGTLLFYNEPAEALLGRVFDEAGEMPIAEWSTIFRPTDDEGRPLEPDVLPLVVALKQRQPARRALWIVGLDGVPRNIGEFTVGADGAAAVTASAPGAAPGTVLALTLEPGAGATTPTMPIVASGEARAAEG